MFDELNRTWAESLRLRQEARETRLVRAALREIRCASVDLARAQIDFAKAVLEASRRVDRTRYDIADD